MKAVSNTAQRVDNERWGAIDKSLLVKALGFSATLLHGDTAVWDRWRWLRRRLPKTANAEKVIDIGCGTGAFSIGAALRGYDVLGLSWDERNQMVARERASLCDARSARFEVQDVRQLDSRTDLEAGFDVAICCENIEHIIDDRKLIVDIAACLKPGGRLLLTTPSYHYRPIGLGDLGPFVEVEDGGHVRRGYTKAMLEELCGHANLRLEEVSYCTGYLSQKAMFVLRALSEIHPLFAWAVILPFRALPPLFDHAVGAITHWPYYCICVEAYKPRFRPVGD
jgi:2-polyprenyl-3-methyl-5-hydroxy-6-metoxy-1,4-benzoquinol methylase